jgi:SpoIID/LytB domain protein
MLRLARAALLALIVGSLVVPPAAAEDVVRIRGGGWGHGIGMSQYGAYGRAKSGASAADIVRHYYSGVNISKRKMPSRIRVGLAQYKDVIGVTSSAMADGGGKVVFKVAGKDAQLATGGSNAEWRVEASNTGGLRLIKDGEQVKENGVGVHGSPEEPLVLLYEPYGTKVHPQYKPAVGYAYGRMEFDAYPSDRCSGGFCLRLIVVLPMQKYLYGLGEVPSSWPQSALQAQALAGRTYAYDKVQRSGQHREPCDCAVFDSVVDQAYIGEGKRDSYFEEWKRAVDATKSKVVLHDGSPIQALYSSSSGGHTENNENVWGGTPLPYLRGVQDRADAVDANPNHQWSFEITYNEFETRLDRAYGIGKLQDFNLLKPFGVSGRVTVVKSDDKGGARIVGSNKTVRESGWSLRSALGLKDTLFRVRITYGVGEQFVQKYQKLNGRPGHPTSSSYAVPRGAKRPAGRAQNFQRGRMTWRKKTDKVTWQRGPILRRYNKLGREKGSLGMPTSDVWGPGNYLGAMYVRGLIMWSKQTGARAVLGGFKREYMRNGGAQGALGLPKARKQKSRTLPRDGRLQRFTNGTIYLNPGAGGGIFALWGAIGDRYRKMGEARSVCGYPTASQVNEGGGATAIFQHGKIETTAKGALRVDC